MRKTLSYMLVAAALTCGVTSALAEYTAPTDAQIDGLLADPQGLDGLVKGATPQQIADVVDSAVDKVDASNLTDDQKQQVVAILAAEAVLAAGDKAPEVVKLIVQQTDKKWLGTIVASAVVAGEAQASEILAAVLTLFAPDSPDALAAKAAAAQPAYVLGAQLYALIKSLVSPTKGAAVPGGVIPPIRRPVTGYEGQ